jgi:hypothetical protein
MLRDGVLYRTALPGNGQLVVNDAATRTYTLHVQSYLGNQQCGTADKAVTVNRFLRVVAQALGPNGILGGPPDTSCIEPGSSVTVWVKVSCPAPAGGLPVTITSLNPARVAGANATIPEGTHITTAEVIAGSDCGPAVLTVAVPNHLPKNVYCTVAGPPVINTAAPTSFKTCDPISVTLDGSCLGETAADIKAWIDVSGQPLPGAVTVLNPETSLRIDLPPLPAGSYPLAVSHCSQTTYAATPITVVTAPPSIPSPLYADVPAIHQDSNRQETAVLILQWTVKDATRITLNRGSDQITQRDYPNDCAPHADSFTDSVHLPTALVTYTLTAFNADGAMATSALLFLM